MASGPEPERRTINVSLRELYVTTNRALLVAGAGPGRSRQIARLLVAAQLRGQPGLQWLATQAGAEDFHGTALTLTNSEPGIMLDANGAGSPAVALETLDLASSIARRNGFGVVLVRRMSALPLFPAVTVLAMKRGLAAIAGAALDVQGGGFTFIAASDTESLRGGNRSGAAKLRAQAAEAGAKLPTELNTCLISLIRRLDEVNAKWSGCPLKLSGSCLLVCWQPSSRPSPSSSAGQRSERGYEWIRADTPETAPTPELSALNIGVDVDSDLWARASSRASLAVVPAAAGLRDHAGAHIP